MSPLVELLEHPRAIDSPEPAEIPATTPRPTRTFRQSGLFPEPSVKSYRRTREYLDHLKATAAPPERRRAAFLRMKAQFDAKLERNRRNSQ